MKRGLERGSVLAAASAYASGARLRGAARGAAGVVCMPEHPDDREGLR